MRTYIFLAVLLWWLLFLLTFVPALAVGLTWWKGLAAGLAGGFFGVGCSMASYWFAYLISTPGSDVAVIGYFMLPIPSAASAWAICRLWARRLRV